MGEDLILFTNHQDAKNAKEEEEVVLQYCSVKYFFVLSASSAPWRFVEK
jgi:hypothetical protein